ncbi:NlpC/P60 family protein [Luteipulveratus sp. YIM 133132]|uniref:NlpC/P60 family protein n=1 Tax=Luteipulveratus flavus TaxID=3031728 RepID=A0ABT6C7N6_9MICO|nr:MULTISPECIES: NlpC/P60 family protein [unclassified Luteipulveratus]MDE9364183.1 NlpC/P60 family protein [Luteipulveratus sp. YIM 133132]MDF8264944.1 NlpC/P60 family protein [Luteipulveratus sp. YIM 133296]
MTRREVLGLVAGTAGAGFAYTTLRSLQALPASAATSTPTASAAATTAPPVSLDVDKFTFTRAANPARTLVHDASKHLVATFTDTSRTVTLAGQMRTFAEPEGTGATIKHATWVRFAPQAWVNGAERTWAKPWLVSALQDRSPDMLAIAMQYIQSARDLKDTHGVRYAGNASFGPLGGPGQPREEASDFYDFLGKPWTFPDGRVKPFEQIRLGAMDCSGFLRMVLGYRMGFPMMSRSDRKPGPMLPRRAYAMAGYAPGTLIIANRNVQPDPAELKKLLPGDLVFFETNIEIGIDHSGIFMGVDSDGKHRFISSRGEPDGPTMGDVGRESTLDGNGPFTRGFRTSRRI